MGCGGDFGNCADLESLACVSSGAFSECVKTARNVGFSQRTERCDHAAGGCGAGLRCNAADNHCERDPDFVPPTPTTTTAPTTQTTAPTQAPTPAPTPATTAAPVPTPAPTPSGGQAMWQQCGGNNWTGATSCVSGATCRVSNEWYSQCVPSSQ